MKRPLSILFVSAHLVACAGSTDLPTSHGLTDSRTDELDEAVSKTMIRLSYEVTGEIVASSSSAPQGTHGFREAQALIREIFPVQTYDFHRIVGSGNNGVGITMYGETQPALDSARKNLIDMGLLVEEDTQDYLRHSALPLPKVTVVQFEITGPISVAAAASSSRSPSDEESTKVKRAMAEFLMRYGRIPGIVGVGEKMLDTLGIFVESAADLQEIKRTMRRDSSLATVRGLDLFISSNANNPDSKESDFFGKTYVGRSTSTRLTFLSNQAESGFRECHLRFVSPELPQPACVWELSVNRNELIVWVRGNRDVYEIKDGGRLLDDGGSMLDLVD